MTEAQKAKTNATRKIWRENNKEKVKKQWRDYARRQRETNPQHLKDIINKSREKKKENEKIGYVVEGNLVSTEQSLIQEFKAIDYKGMSEYQILKSFREQYKKILESNMPYTVWKVRPSRFDKVPHEPDETKNGMYHLINQ